MPPIMNLATSGCRSRSDRKISGSGWPLAMLTDGGSAPADDIFNLRTSFHRQFHHHGRAPTGISCNLESWHEILTPTSGKSESP